MDAPGALLALAILIAVLAIVLRPLVVGPTSRKRNRSGHNSPLARQVDERARLLERRNAVYAAIRELDFDYETGKVSDEEHARQRAQLVREGVAILKQLDRLEVAVPAADPLEAAIAAMRRGEEGQVDAARPVKVLDAEVGGLRATPAANGQYTCPTCGAPASCGDRFCGDCGESLDMACAECGTPYQPGDLFCAHCGAALEAQG